VDTELKSVFSACCKRSLCNQGALGLGTSINTVRQAIRITRDGGDKTELVKTLAPSVGNFLTALETVLNDMQVKDPWHRQRLKYKATPAEVAIKAEGGA